MKTVVAFNKLLWIQNDYFAKWYVRDGEQYTGKKGNVVASDMAGSNSILMAITVCSVAVAAWALMSRMPTVGLLTMAAWKRILILSDSINLNEPFVALHIHRRTLDAGQWTLA